MQGLASFDRCLAQRHAVAAPAARSAGRPSLNRYLIGPLVDQVLPLAAPSDARALLKLAHGIGPNDWLGVLAEEGSSHTPAWRLAVCRAAGGLEWLSPAWPARAGTAPQQLQAELQARAVQALWAQGWRVEEGVPALNTPV